MKRVFTGISLAFFLIVIMPTAAFAMSTNTYSIDDLNMSIAIPSDYVVFTRDIDANDPNLSLYGLTKELMESNNIYLDAWDSDMNYQIVVTMTDSSLEDLSLYSDTSLSTLTTSLESEYKKAGNTFIASEIYQHDQAKFLKIHYSQPSGDSTIYGLQYFTIYANKAINIIMNSSATINDSNENVLKSIVDSVKFGTDPQVATTAQASTSAFQYGNIILNLILIIILYSSPIIFYRFVIRESPVELRKAKKIAIIYGISAFIVMLILIFTINENNAAAGGAILLWSYVNYRILTSGTSKSSEICDDSIGKEMNNSSELLKKEDELCTQNNICEQESSKNNPATENNDMKDIQQDLEIMYCHKCGSKLFTNSLFCPKCGTQVPNKGRE